MNFLTSNLKQIDPELLKQIIILDKEQNRWSWAPKDWITTPDKECHYISVLHSPSLIGFTLWNLDKVDHRAHLLKILVEFHFRKQGLGKKLLESSLLDLKQKGYKTALLEVDVDNSQAIKLYELAQFKIIHRSKGFYSNGSDAFIMEKAL